MSIRLRTVAVLTVLLSVATPSASQQPIFRSAVDGVRIDVLATNGATPITGLGPDDFEVRDNGILQTITVTPRAGMPVQVILAVDTSRSIDGPRLDALRTAGKDLLAALAEGDEAGLITFSESAVRRVPITSEWHRIEAALTATMPAGDTALVDATLSAMLLAEAEASRALVMVFSDGTDTASFMAPEVALETARAGNIVVYGVWSGHQGKPEFLGAVADVSGGRVIDVSRTGNIAGAFVAIVREFRQRYLITFTPSGVEPGGWHRLDVRVKRRGADVQFRRGYFGRQP